MENRFHIIKKTYLRLIIGLVVVAGSWLLLAMNMRFSIEFTGGMQMNVQAELPEDEVTNGLETFLESKGYENTKVGIESGEQSGLSVRTKVEDDEKVTELSDLIQNYLLDNSYISTSQDILELSITGPSVGSYMQGAATKALVIGLIFMAIYMMFSFASIREYVSPGTLAIVTIVTMLFDVSIPAGAYGFLMMINPTISIDVIFVIAILTVMGYSINDTIVIFDRIRENMQKQGEKKDIIYGNVFEKSLWQTMRRSIGTSLSTLLVVVAMYFFGEGVIKQFAFTMGIGVIAGTYSSIFVAAPLAYLMLGKYKKEEKKLK